MHKCTWNISRVYHAAGLQLPFVNTRSLIMMRCRTYGGVQQQHTRRSLMYFPLGGPGHWRKEGLDPHLGSVWSRNGTILFLHSDQTRQKQILSRLHRERLALFCCAIQYPIRHIKNLTHDERWVVPFPQLNQVPPDFFWQLLRSFGCFFVCNASVKVNNRAKCPWLKQHKKSKFDRRLPRYLAFAA